MAGGYERAAPNPSGSSGGTPPDLMEVGHMFELWYWCIQRGGEWRPLGGEDYSSLQQAATQAQAMSNRSGRAMQVRDLFTGEVMYQSATPQPGLYATARAPRPRVHPDFLG